MALKGDQQPNFESFDIGSSRIQVERQLGEASETKNLENGTLQKTYQYVIGDTPSGARATMHILLDAVTLFIWEIPGTIMESRKGHKKETVVVYDQNDRAIQIQGYKPQNFNAKK